MSTAAERAHLQQVWDEKLAAAEAMVPLIGRLYRRDDVVPSVHGRPLVGQSPIGIVKAHRSSRRVDETELPVATSLAILTELDTMALSSVSVDLGDLASRHRRDRLGSTLREFLTDEFFLHRGTADGPHRDAPRDVVLYGFGRIGRMLARILLERAGEHAPLALRAVVVRRRGPGDLVKRAGGSLRGRTVVGCAKPGVPFAPMADAARWPIYRIDATAYDQFTNHTQEGQWLAGAKKSPAGASYARRTGRRIPTPTGTRPRRSCRGRSPLAGSFRALGRRVLPPLWIRRRTPGALGA
ncbi:hypothetical protein [Curtobacterium sp. ODYSSEY 48 V2]|uniref:hypothetical protein n=1 Tax=Curtobacterium sp. ODYSSEY 48 V2 TaxID=2939561 RepID=UPI00203D2098|nr:hypothetical protein [Curtobacterium sp. ODYSSEY 48 V2]